MKKCRLFLGLLALIASCAPVRAEVRLPALFSDHMVLQREKAINIWGWARPGEPVRITITGPHTIASGEARADSEGDWVLELPALKAGGPYKMTVASSNVIEIEDILVGEVWLCSGQSNMEMAVHGVLDAEQEIQQSSNPQLRMFTVARHPSGSLQTGVTGQWQQSAPESTANFSATAYFFGKRLQRELGVPIGLINSSHGGTKVEAWTSLSAQKSDKKLAHIISAWDKRIAESSDLHRDKNRPGNLFNGMIAPLVPYSIRGVTWYQGESNTHPEEAQLYSLQLATLIKDWRDRMNQGDFPFLWVQLPGFGSRQQEPVEDTAWVAVRDQMLQPLSLPNTGTVITTDLGEANNVHPRNKQAVGHRLAQWALATTYGKDTLIKSGPIFSTMSISGSKIALHFDDMGDGLRTVDGREVRGFAIAGPDQKFFWAEAKITEDGIVVWNEDVSRPIAVRYNWASNPLGNLVNSAGFPTSPFRTDDWKLYMTARWQ